MKKLPNLHWTPAWASLVGCIHGCLKHLGIDPGFSWLYGGTGHAFIINMSQDGSCPSGPTAWNTSRLYELGPNLGFRIEGIFADKRQLDFAHKQAAAWELATRTLDQGLPLVGWDLAIPEFYVVEGYDAVGYFYNGPGAENQPQPKPWKELGLSEIGMLQLFSGHPTQASADRKVILEALEFAAAFNAGSSEWVLNDYRAGLEAYQVWINAVESGKAELMGHAYNAAVWGECRHNAVAFLQECRKRLGGAADQPLAAAIRSYGEVANQLKQISEIFPFFENNHPGTLGQNPQSQKAADHLQAAHDAESDGLGLLKEIIRELS